MGADGIKHFEDSIKRQLERDSRISGKTQVVDTRYNSNGKEH
jgi:hypothetical protein